MTVTRKVTCFFGNGEWQFFGQAQALEIQSVLWLFLAIRAPRSDFEQIQGNAAQAVDSFALGHFLWHSKSRGSLDNGELLLVATHSDREQTEHLVQLLREHWPGAYVVQEIADRDYAPLNDKPSQRLREFSYAWNKICGD